MQGVLTAIWKWLVENWEGILATCGLGISAWTLYQQRRHDRLSVRPHLVFLEDSNEAENTYECRLINSGLGPAVIREFRVSRRGAALKHYGPLGPANPYTEMFEGIVGIQLKWGAHRPGTMFAQGESLTVFQIIVPAGTVDSSSRAVSTLDIRARLNDYSIDIEYESIYGEKFMFGSFEGISTAP